MDTYQDVGRSAREQIGLRSTVFAMMWAAAHIIHLAIQSQEQLTDPTEIVVFLLAVTLLVRPRSERLLVILAVAQIVDWWSAAPLSPDHWTFVMATNSILVFGAMASTVGIWNAPASLVERSMTGLRVALLVAYGAAAFAKWNTTFLDPATSCAAFLLGCCHLRPRGWFSNRRFLCRRFRCLCRNHDVCAAGHSPNSACRRQTRPALSFDGQPQPGDGGRRLHRCGIGDVRVVPTCLRSDQRRGLASPGELRFARRRGALAPAVDLLGRFGVHLRGTRTRVRARLRDAGVHAQLHLPDRLCPSARVVECSSWGRRR